MKTTLRLGHIGDMHVSQRIRPDERRRAMNEAIAILAREGVDLTVIPGDLYDGSPTVADEQEVREYLVDLAGTCPVAIAGGNHDPACETVKLGRLRTGADAYSHRHPILATETPVVWDIAGFRVAALPHVTKAQATANLSADATIGEGDSAARTYVQSTLARFRDELRGFAGPRILISHADVVGAVASNGESRRDAALALSVEDLERVGASAVCLSHIHREQTFGDGSLWYAGSVYQKDFGERNDRKSVIVATFDMATGRILERVAHPLPQRPMWKIEGMLTEDGWAHVDSHRPLPGSWEWPAVEPDAEIWILLHYPSNRRSEYLAMRDEADRRYPGARIEGRGIPVVERRSVEFAAASGLADSFTAWRRSEGDYAPLVPSLEGKLEVTEAAVPGFGHVAGGPSAESAEGLVLGDLRYSGINSVESEIVIPYGSRDMRGIICFAGPNGSGKTTSFESSLASLTREFAYYGNNVPNRSKNGGYIAQSFRMAGHEYQSTIRISAKGAVEAALVRDGQALNDPKLLTKFDAAIAEVVGTKDLLELTVFARQADSPEGKQGFFNLKPADRTARIIELTGCQKYEAAAKFAGDQRKALDVPIGEARKEVDSIERQLLALDDQEALEPGGAGGFRVVEGLRSQLKGAEAGRNIKASYLGSADEAWREAVRAEAEIKALPEGADSVQRDLDAKTIERNELREKAVRVLEDLRGQQATAGRRGEVETAIGEVGTIGKDLETSRGNLADSEEHIETLQAKAQEMAEIGTAIATKERVRSEVLHAAERKRQDALAGVIQAARDCRVAAEQARAQADAIEAENAAGVRMAEQKSKEAEGALGASKTKLQDAEAQAQVRTPFAEKCIEAGCEFTARAKAARESIPALEADIEAKAMASASAFAAIDRAKGKAAEDREYNEQRVEGLWAQLDSAARERDEAQAKDLEDPAEAVALAGEIATLKSSLSQLEPTSNLIAATRERIGNLRDRIKNDEQRLTLARETAALLPVIEAATKRAAELDAELAAINGQGVALKAACEELQRRLDGLAEHDRLCAEAKAATALAEANRKAIEADVDALKAQVNSLLGQIAQLEALQPQLDAARSTLARLSADQAEWALIEKGCGKHGLQALAIDEAGPEIADLVNRILLECHGPRWTFGMVTQEEKADGKGVTNRFVPAIFDRGEPRDRVSGGEGAILDIAARLALAIYNGRHSGRRYQAIWLDEAAQAVGVEHAATYIGMLRLAAELGGFVQICIISHLPAIWSMVDWLVRMRDTQDGALPPAVESIEQLTAARVEAPAREKVAA